jgi:Icc-related predicted phosphoesterase
MRLAWTTDIHIPHARASETRIAEFYKKMARSDAILIGGDIGEARSTPYILREMEKAIQKPIFFVLGNHDFYRGSVSEVRMDVVQICKASKYLHYLSAEEVVQLTPKVGLVGVDGWGDARAGDYEGSTVSLADFSYILDLSGKSHEQRKKVLERFGDESAQWTRDKLTKAFDLYKRVIFLTHVPPFVEAGWHRGKIQEPDWQPYFICLAVGKVLRELMTIHKDKKLTVLCGHTHSSGHVKILPNLEVYTGKASYGYPEVQKLIKL